MVINSGHPLFRCAIAIVLLLTSHFSHAAELVAQLDRAEVSEGQSVTLTITATDLDGEPDLGVLESDFEVLDTSRSRNVRITNGQTQSSMVWQLGLMPLRSGTLTIPALSMDGQQSESIELVVRKAGTVSESKGSEEFMLELSVDKQAPFVQEQVILSAKVFQSRSIIEGSLSDPQSDGVILERLGNDRTYTSKIGDTNYQVIERKYAVFPQESGELSIGPLRLVASVRQDGRSTQSLFTPTRKISVSSNRVTLDVKPRTNGTGWWLPAETLSLAAEWNEMPDEVTVDEPITRTIQLSVKGLHGTQLPSIEPPELDTARIYPDQAETQNQVVDDSIVSYRTQKWAIIPRKPGPLVMPEIRLEWFDTLSREVRVAVLPEQTIHVSAKASDSVSEKPALAESTKQADELRNEATDNVASEKLPAAEPVVREVEVSNVWKILAIVSLVGWLLTMIVWWWKSRIGGAQKARSSKMLSRKNASLRDVVSACDSNNPSRISEALLTWAKLQWADDVERPRNLSQLASKLGSVELLQFFTRLEQSLYSTDSEPVDCGELVAKIRQAIQSMPADRKDSLQSNPLPEL